MSYPLAPRKLSPRKLSPRCLPSIQVGSFQGVHPPECLPFRDWFRNVWGHQYQQIPKIPLARKGGPKLWGPAMREVEGQDLGGGPQCPGGSSDSQTRREVSSTRPSPAGSNSHSSGEQSWALFPLGWKPERNLTSFANTCGYTLKTITGLSILCFLQNKQACRPPWACFRRRCHLSCEVECWLDLSPLWDCQTQGKQGWQPEVGSPGGHGPGPIQVLSRIVWLI
jgi:hypothetical protein